MMPSRVTAVFSFLVMLAVSGTLLAQTQTGTVTGKVTDQSDAVMPGVSVSIASEVLITGTQVTTTNATGLYRFTQLPTGTYDVTFELSGFATTRQEQIAVEAFFVATVNVIMTVATVEEVITVTGESPTVDVKSSVLSTTVDRDMLDQVPSGKDIWVIAEQVPGVVQNKYNIGGTESAQQSRSYIHGASGQQEFAFDGLTNNWPGSNGAFVMVYFDYESFAEVQVVTSAAPAELGTSGLYMNMVTKSGGNDLHGGVTFSIEPGQWQGNNVDDELRAQGLETGGNKVDRIYNFAPTLGGPIVRNKMWFFGSYLRYDVNTQLPGFTRPDGSPEVDVNHQTNIMAKLTTQINDNNKLMGMYYFNYQNRFFRRSSSGFTSQEASWRQIEPAHIVQGQWTSILPNETFLDARLGYVTHVFPLAPQDEVQPSDIARFDTGFNERTVANELYRWHTAPRTQFNISLAGFASGFGGSHDWKIGGGYSRQHTFSDNTLNGDYSMRFFNGEPDEVRTFSEVTGQRDDYHIVTLFVQDSWTIADRLTINPGLRMEKFRGFYPDQGSPANIFFPAVSFTKVDNVPNFTNVVPRFGLSFDLMGDGRTALKGSFSKFTQLEGSRLTGAINPNGRRFEARAWDDRNGNLFAELDEFGDVLSRGGGVNVSFDPETTRPLTYEATAGIEHQLGRDLSVSATYYHRKNYNYFNRINRAVPITSYTPISIVGPEGQSITVFNQDLDTVGMVDRVITSDVPEFFEKYNGVEFTGRKRLSNGWQLLAGYTYGEGKGFNPNFNTDVNNPNNLINQRDAFQNQDRTHMIKFNGTYIFPGDFSVSTNYRYYTGQPLTRTFSVSLNQGRVNVPAEPRGAFRFDNVSILDLRVAKRFNFDTWSVEGQFDIFNALNSNAVTRANTTIGPSFGDPTQILTPIIVGIGMRLTF